MKMLLDERLSAISRKIEELDVSNRKIIVWGMGHVADLYGNAFRTERIDIFAYTAKGVSEGGEYNGHRIIAPESIIQIDNPLVLINVKNPKYVKEIQDEIETMESKIEYMLVDEFFFGRKVETIVSNVKILVDEKSKRIYTSLIEHLLDNDLKMYDLYEGNQYWAIPPFHKEDINEVVVDMGGFVGDTLEKYLFKKVGTFKNYYVFEPNEKNYTALKKRIARLNEEWALSENQIIPIFAGVGKENGSFYFEETKCDGASSHYTKEKTGIERKVVNLDTYFKDIKVTFLKADIESYEFDMLQGAVNIIKRDKPKLAICIYHNAVDMYHILDWLKDLNLGYQFYIRHHSVHEAETVLYACVEES